MIGVSKTIDHIQIKIKIPNPSKEPPASSKASNQDLRTYMFFAPSKSRYKATIWSMGVLKTSYHIPIKIKMPTQVRNIQHPPENQMRT